METLSNSSLEHRFPHFSAAAHGRRRYLFFFLFFILSISFLHAYPGDRDVLDIEFWTELDPMVQAEGSGVISQEEAIRRTLEEARNVISGMIYGYEVVYTPSDRSRNVEERLEIEARALVPKGDERLRVMQVRMNENKYYVRIRYDLRDFQADRLQAWSSNTMETASGRGTAPLQLGYRGKFESFEQGIKTALRNYLRARIRNKPRVIRAIAAFQEAPYTIIDAGGYHSTVRIRFQLQEVLPYSAY